MNNLTIEEIIKHLSEAYGSNFKQIQGFPDYYVSESGMVFSSKSNILLFPSLNRNGYEHVRIISEYNERKTITVHRLVALTFIDPVAGKDVINHIDGNKENNHVSNLEWTDQTENKRHYHRLARACINNINYLREAYETHKNDKDEFMRIFAKRVMAK